MIFVFTNFMWWLFVIAYYSLVALCALILVRFASRQVFVNHLLTKRLRLGPFRLLARRPVVASLVQFRWRDIAFMHSKKTNSWLLASFDALCQHVFFQTSLQFPQLCESAWQTLLKAECSLFSIREVHVDTHVTRWILHQLRIKYHHGPLVHIQVNGLRVITRTLPQSKSGSAGKQSSVSLAVRLAVGLLRLVKVTVEDVQLALVPCLDWSEASIRSPHHDTAVQAPYQVLSLHIRHIEWCVPSKSSVLELMIQLELKYGLDLTYACVDFETLILWLNDGDCGSDSIKLIEQSSDPMTLTVTFRGLSRLSLAKVQLDHTGQLVMLFSLPLLLWYREQFFPNLSSASSEESVPVSKLTVVPEVAMKWSFVQFSFVAVDPNGSDFRNWTTLQKHIHSCNCLDPKLVALTCTLNTIEIDASLPSHPRQASGSWRRISSIVLQPNSSEVVWRGIIRRECRIRLYGAEMNHLRPCFDTRHVSFTLKKDNLNIRFHESVFIVLPLLDLVSLVQNVKPLMKRNEKSRSSSGTTSINLFLNISKLTVHIIAKDEIHSHLLSLECHQLQLEKGLQASFEKFLVRVWRCQPQFEATVVPELLTNGWIPFHYNYAYFIQKGAPYPLPRLECGKFRIDLTTKSVSLDGLAAFVYQDQKWIDSIKLLIDQVKLVKEAIAPSSVEHEKDKENSVPISVPDIEISNASVAFVFTVSSTSQPDQLKAMQYIALRVSKIRHLQSQWQIVALRLVDQRVALSGLLSSSSLEDAFLKLCNEQPLSLWMQKMADAASSSHEPWFVVDATYSASVLNITALSLGILTLDRCIDAIYQWRTYIQPEVESVLEMRKNTSTSSTVTNSSIDPFNFIVKSEASFILPVKLPWLAHCATHVSSLSVSLHEWSLQLSRSSPVLNIPLIRITASMRGQSEELELFTASHNRFTLIDIMDDSISIEQLVSSITEKSMPPWALQAGVPVPHEEALEGSLCAAMSWVTSQIIASIPFGFVLGDLIDHLICMRKAIIQETRIDKKEKSTFDPQSPRRFPKYVRLQAGDVQLSIGDDPFEMRLNRIFRVGLEEQLHRLARERAFWNKLDARSQLSSKTPISPNLRRLSTMPFLSMSQARVRAWAFKYPHIFATIDPRAIIEDERLIRAYTMLQETNAKLYVSRMRQVNESPDDDKLLTMNLTRLQLKLYLPLLLRPREELYTTWRAWQKKTVPPIEEFLLYDTVWPLHLFMSAGMWFVSLRDYSEPMLMSGRFQLRGLFFLVEDLLLPAARYYRTVRSESLRVSVQQFLSSFKIYHSFVLHFLEQASVVYGSAHDPCLSDVSTAASSLTKTSFDSSPPLPFWDKMRFLLHSLHSRMIAWRGFELKMTATLDPYISNESLVFVAPRVMDAAIMESGSVLLAGDFHLIARTALLPGLSVSLSDEGAVLNTTSETIDDILIIDWPRMILELELVWQFSGASHHSVRYEAYPNDSDYDAYAKFRSSSVVFHLKCRDDLSSMTVLETLPSDSRQIRVSLYPQLLDWLAHFFTLYGSYVNLVRLGKLFDYGPVRVSAVLDRLNNAAYQSGTREVKMTKRTKLSYVMSDLSIDALLPKMDIQLIHFYGQRQFVGLRAQFGSSRWVLHYSHRLQFPMGDDKALVRFWRVEYLELDCHSLIIQTLTCGKQGELCVEDVIWSPRLLYVKVDDDDEESASVTAAQATRDPRQPFFAQRVSSIEQAIQVSLNRLSTLDPALQLDSLISTRRSLTVLEEKLELYTKYLGKTRWQLGDEPLPGTMRDHRIAHRFLTYHFNVWWREPVRNAFFKLINLMSQHSTFTYYLTTSAVSYVRKLVKVFDDNAQDHLPNSSNNNPSTLATEMAEEMLQQLVEDRDIRFTVNVADDELDEQLLSSPELQLERSVGLREYWRQKLAQTDAQTRVSTHFSVQFVSPQIHFQTTASAQCPQGCLLLTADRAVLDSFLLVDRKTSQNVKRKTFVKLDTAQFFVALRDSLPLLSEWPVFLPTAALVDLGSVPDHFVRVSRKTSLSLTHEHNNPLYVTEKVKANTLSVMLPVMAITSTSTQYCIIHDVISNLLLYREPAQRRYQEDLRTILLASDLHETRDTVLLVLSLQERIRALNASMLGDARAGRRFEIWRTKRDLRLSLQEELAVLIQALHVIKDSHRSTAGAGSANTRFHVMIQVRQLSWLLISQEQPLCEVSVQGANVSLITREDDAILYQAECDGLWMKNRLPDPVYEEVLGPLQQQDPNNATRRLIRVIWSEMPPVGGIPVVEQLEISIAPLALRLTYSLASQLISFIFPYRQQQPAQPSAAISAPPASSSVTSKSLPSSAPVPLATDEQVLEMKQRASQYRTFLFIHMPGANHRVSYHGKRDSNIEDIDDFPLKLPSLEYRNQTWTWLELMVQIRKDAGRILLSHTGSLVKEKFKRLGQKQRPAVKPSSSSNPPPVQVAPTPAPTKKSILATITKKLRGHSRSKSEQILPTLQEQSNVSTEVEVEQATDTASEQPSAATRSLPSIVITDAGAPGENEAQDEMHRKMLFGVL